MTTLTRRRLAIIIFATSITLAFGVGFSTPVFNGQTIAALLLLAAGAYATIKIQQIAPGATIGLANQRNDEAEEATDHRQAA